MIGLGSSLPGSNPCGIHLFDLTHWRYTAVHTMRDVISDEVDQKNLAMRSKGTTMDEESDKTVPPVHWYANEAKMHRLYMKRLKEQMMMLQFQRELLKQQMIVLQFQREKLKQQRCNARKMKEKLENLLNGGLMINIISDNWVKITIRCQDSYQSGLSANRL
jgi:hypothetical protein